jgi:hypothetical protein
MNGTTLHKGKKHSSEIQYQVKEGKMAGAFITHNQGRTQMGGWGADGLQLLSKSKLKKHIL